MAAHNNIAERKKLFAKIKKEILDRAKKGPDGKLSFKRYAKEHLTNNTYWALAKVVSDEYNVDIYDTIKLGLSAVLDIAWASISKNTAPAFSYSLKALQDSKSVYQIGPVYYAKSWDLPIGQIQQTDNDGSWPLYRDTYLVEKRDRKSLTDLVCSRGYSEQTLTATATFSPGPTQSWPHGSLVFYGATLYGCISAHTHSPTTPISPTYSAYWKQFSTWTYSTATFGDDNKTLITKYSQAIDFLLDTF